MYYTKALGREFPNRFILGKEKKKDETPNSYDSYEWVYIRAGCPKAFGIPQLPLGSVVLSVSEGRKVGSAVCCYLTCVISPQHSIYPVRSEKMADVM